MSKTSIKDKIKKIIINKTKVIVGPYLCGKKAGYKIPTMNSYSRNRYLRDLDFTRLKIYHSN